MTNEETLIAEIQTLPSEDKDEVIDAVLRLIKTLKKQQAVEPERKARRAGSHPGAFVMSPDFDEPLEEFEDYM